MTTSGKTSSCALRNSGELSTPNRCETGLQAYWKGVFKSSSDSTALSHVGWTVFSISAKRASASASTLRTAGTTCSGLMPSNRGRPSVTSSGLSASSVSGTAAPVFSVSGERRVRVPTASRGYRRFCGIISAARKVRSSVGAQPADNLFHALELFSQRGQVLAGLGHHLGRSTAHELFIGELFVA